MITLTTPVAFTINGVNENDTIGACVSVHQDFQAMTLTAVYMIGPAVSGNPPALNQGAAALANGYLLTVTMNLNTGVWSYSYAGITGGGTLVGATLTSQQAQFIAMRNQAEAFVAVAGGLMPGVQTNWTQL